MKKINARERRTLLHQLHARLAVERARDARRRLCVVMMAIHDVPFDVISEAMKVDERAIRAWLARVLDGDLAKVGARDLGAPTKRSRDPGVRKLRDAIAAMLKEK